MSDGTDNVEGRNGARGPQGGVAPLGHGDELTQQCWHGLVTAYGDDLDKLYACIRVLEDRDAPALNRLLSSMFEWKPTQPDPELLLRYVALTGTRNRLQERRAPPLTEVRSFLDIVPRICVCWYLGRGEKIDGEGAQPATDVRSIEDQMENAIEVFADCAGRCLGRFKDEEWQRLVEKSMANVQTGVAAHSCPDAPARCSTCLAACKLASSISTHLGKLPRTGRRVAGVSRRDKSAIDLMEFLASVVRRRVAGHKQCGIEAHSLAHGCHEVFKTVFHKGASARVITDSLLGACFDVAKLDMNTEIHGDMRKIVELVEGRLGGATWSRLPYRARVLLSGLLRDYLKYPRAPTPMTTSLVDVFKRVAKQCERGEVHYDDRVIFPGQRPTCQLIVKGTRGSLSSSLQGELLEASCAGVRVICSGWRVRKSGSSWTLTGVDGKSGRSIKISSRTGAVRLDVAAQQGTRIFWGAYHHDRRDACHCAGDPYVIYVRPTDGSDHVEIGLEFNVDSLIFIVGSSADKLDRSAFVDALREVVGRRRFNITNVSKGPANSSAVELKGDVRVLTSMLGQLRSGGPALKGFARKTRTRSIRWTVGGGLWHELRLRSGSGERGGSDVEIGTVDGSWLPEYSLAVDDESATAQGGGRRASQEPSQPTRGTGRGQAPPRRPDETPAESTPPARQAAKTPAVRRGKGRGARTKVPPPPPGARLVYEYDSDEGRNSRGARLALEWPGRERKDLAVSSGGQLQAVMLGLACQEGGPLPSDFLSKLIEDTRWKLKEGKLSAFVRVADKQLRDRLVVELPGVELPPRLIRGDRRKAIWTCWLPVFPREVSREPTSGSQ